MTRLTFVQPDGSSREIQATEGESVMRTATANLIPGIIGECGGDLSCSTCHVFVDARWSARLAKPSAGELEMLEATAVEPTENSRLGCQIKLDAGSDGLIVHVPITQR